MTVTDYLLFLQKIISYFPFTILDIVFFVCALIFIASEKHRAFVKAFIITLSVITTWCLALLVYSPISSYLQTILFAPKGITDGFTLLLVLGVIGTVLGILYRLFILNADHDLLAKEIPVINSIFGGITFGVISSAVLTILLSFPLTPFIKTTLSQSFVLSSLISFSQTLESSEQKIVGKDSTSTLNFLTLKPSEAESKFISRGMLYSPDNSSRVEILAQLNRVRNDAEVQPLQERDSLSQVAQVLAMRMVTKSQLTQSNIDGSTPFDLLAQKRAVYSQAYFMSAQAQTVNIAIQGFEQIPRYRSEMTASRYSAVGIGAVSLKEHGYIITLLFTD